MKDINLLTLAELKREVRSEAKKANTRLRALEKAGYDKSSFAYRKTAELHEGKHGFTREDYQGRVTYKTATSTMSQSELRAELSALRGFLYESNTSTIIGMRETVNKRVKSFNESVFGDDKSKYMTNEEFSEIMANESVKSLYNTYGSDVFIIAKEYEDIPIDAIARELEKNRGVYNARIELDKYKDKWESQTVSEYEPIINIEDYGEPI
jgi:hypothetical protein